MNVFNAPEKCAACGREGGQQEQQARTISYRQGNNGIQIINAGNSRNRFGDETISYTQGSHGIQYHITGNVTGGRVGGIISEEEAGARREPNPRARQAADATAAADRRRETQHAQAEANREQKARLLDLLDQLLNQQQEPARVLNVRQGNNGIQNFGMDNSRNRFGNIAPNLNGRIAEGGQASSSDSESDASVEEEAEAPPIQRPGQVAGARREPPRERQASEAQAGVEGQGRREAAVPAADEPVPRGPRGPELPGAEARGEAAADDQRPGQNAGARRDRENRAAAAENHPQDNEQVRLAQERAEAAEQALAEGRRAMSLLQRQIDEMQRQMAELARGPGQQQAEEISQQNAVDEADDEADEEAGDEADNEAGDKEDLGPRVGNENTPHERRLGQQQAGLVPLEESGEVEVKAADAPHQPRAGESESLESDDESLAQDTAEIEGNNDLDDEDSVPRELVGNEDAPHEQVEGATLVDEAANEEEVQEGGADEIGGRNGDDENLAQAAAELRREKHELDRMRRENERLRALLLNQQQAGGMETCEQ